MLRWRSANHTTREFPSVGRDFGGRSIKGMVAEETRCGTESERPRAAMHHGGRNETGHIPVPNLSDLISLATTPGAAEGSELRRIFFRVRPDACGSTLRATEAERHRNSRRQGTGQGKRRSCQNLQTRTAGNANRHRESMGSHKHAQTQKYPHIPISSSTMFSDSDDAAACVPPCKL